MRNPPDYTETTRRSRMKSRIQNASYMPQWDRGFGPLEAGTRTDVTTSTPPPIIHVHRASPYNSKIKRLKYQQTRANCRFGQHTQQQNQHQHQQHQLENAIYSKNYLLRWSGSAAIQGETTPPELESLRLQPRSAETKQPNKFANTTYDHQPQTKRNSRRVLRSENSSQARRQARSKKRHISRNLFRHP